MNWKEEAKRELRGYEALKASIPNLSDTLAEIAAAKTSLRSASDPSPIYGGGSTYEDRLTNLLTKEAAVKDLLRASRFRLRRIERGLAALSEEERAVALCFSAHRSGEAVEILTERLGLEQAQIYRIWNEALRRFTIAEYGLPEY